jgi:hypothetical protein
MTTSKIEITQALIDSLAEGHNVTLDWAMNHWWVNIRSTGGLRLTDLGFQCLTVLNVKSYSVEVNPETFDRRVMLELDRKLKAPYYIQTSKKIPKKIIMFSSREAMMATLYGDIVAWLGNIKR